MQPILNTNSPHAHKELKFCMLGVARKLVKYVVHLSKRFFIFIFILLLILFPQGAQTINDQFLILRNFRG
jgi:hypothetical protein